MAQSVILMIPGGDATETTLERFFEANELPTEERAEIRSAVVMHGVYHGGGGAAPDWILSTAEHLRSAARA